MMKVYVGSDHAGYHTKLSLLKALQAKGLGVEFVDVGCDSERELPLSRLRSLSGRKVVSEKARGILICGSGLGMCVAANKIKGIRATSSWDVTSAKLSRQHNDSNIICLGARLTGMEVAIAAVEAWLGTEFLGDRHQHRVDRITQLEAKWKA